MSDRVNNSSTLEALRARLAKTQAKIADIERREKAQSRKDDTRLKVLIGAAFLADTAKNPETRAGLTAILERAITTARDREFLKAKGWLLLS